MSLCWPSPAAHVRLHVTDSETCHGPGIEAEAFPYEGAAASRAAARTGSAPDEDILRVNQAVLVFLGMAVSPRAKQVA
jgi:hypothetical protein